VNIVFSAGVSVSDSAILRDWAKYNVSWDTSRGKNSLLFFFVGLGMSRK
jgi:hypothetical protein